MNRYVIGFEEINKSMLMLVGGKGANLGELSKIEAISIPSGFCVTTEAFKAMVSVNKVFIALVDELSGIKSDEQKRIGDICSRIRRLIEELPVSEEIENEITSKLSLLDDNIPFAVRSSATAEDLPTASFAGQQDTYLNVIGKEAILKSVSRCWASLFTDRAVTYRIQNNIDHRKVLLSVVIQKMVFPQVSGIMFTADPVTSNRKVMSIDASFGLGEALVSGLVNADIYKVRDGQILEKKISLKKLAVQALKGGGTEEKFIEEGRQNEQALKDEQILVLERIGRKIEAYFGRPQDIEWCFVQEHFYVVQSRPITTLYPAPDNSDGKNRVYLSFGHRQMMTEAMKPLGLSFFKDFFSLVSGSALIEIGGRLYMDISRELKSPIMSKPYVKALDTVDVLMQKAVMNLMKRKDYIGSLKGSKKAMVESSAILKWVIGTIRTYYKNDHQIVTDLMASDEAVLNELEQKFEGLSGTALFDFIRDSLVIIKATIYKNYGAVFAGTFASTRLNKKLEKWLGEKNAADSLSQSVPDNVTSEMGLELLDVADIVWKYPAVIDYFEKADDINFFSDLSKLDGGNEVSDALKAYLEKYGMRCSAEIDISKPRWNEKPTILIPMILSNINAYGPNAHAMKFEQGLREAKEKEEDIIKRLEKLPGGRRKIKKVKKLVSVLRNFAGFREYSKYFMVCYLWIIKKALLKEAGRLAENNVIAEKEDVFYLSFAEFKDAIMTNKVDNIMIAKRKEEHELFEKLTPPRVITSDGEIISGEYDSADFPKGALAGVAVSSGVIEGRARVVFKLEDAKMEEGDILVTKFTDPSWTPVFVSIKGLVTEVGGMMTHGAVVAREYGLPAVVSVENATKLINDGQRIRINGTLGYVEII